jgi:hypothetical protein
MFSSPTESLVELPRRRRRPVLSCESCRQRKVKCNRQEPYNQCISSKTTCVYGSKRSRSIMPAGASKLNSPPVLTASYETPQRVFQVSSTPGSSTIQPREPKPFSIPVEHHELYSSQAMTVVSDRITSDDAQICEPQNRGQAPEQPLATHFPNPIERKGDKDPSDKSDSEIGIPWSMDRRIALNKSRLFGQSHWTNGDHEVSAPQIYSSFY